MKFQSSRSSINIFFLFNGEEMSAQIHCITLATA